MPSALPNFINLVQFFQLNSQMILVMNCQHLQRSGICGTAIYLAELCFVNHVADSVTSSVPSFAKKFSVALRRNKNFSPTVPLTLFVYPRIDFPYD